MVWELIKSLIFGIVEGITEWLPISSTGHLILLDEFLKLDASDNFKEMFDVVIQLGAILAVVVIYWNKLWPFGKQNNPHPMAQTGFGACLKKDILQMWCKVIVATVPAAVIGLLLDNEGQSWNDLGLTPDVDAALSSDEQNAYYDYTVDTDPQISKALNTAKMLSGQN